MDDTSNYRARYHLEIRVLHHWNFAQESKIFQFRYLITVRYCHLFEKNWSWKIWSKRGRVCTKISFAATKLVRRVSTKEQQRGSANLSANNRDERPRAALSRAKYGGKKNAVGRDPSVPYFSNRLSWRGRHRRTLQNRGEHRWDLKNSVELGRELARFDG